MLCGKNGCHTYRYMQVHNYKETAGATLARLCKGVMRSTSKILIVRPNG